MSYASTLIDKEIAHHKLKIHRDNFILSKQVSAVKDTQKPTATGAAAAMLLRYTLPQVQFARHHMGCLEWSSHKTA